MSIPLSAKRLALLGSEKTGHSLNAVLAIPPGTNVARRFVTYRAVHWVGCSFFCLDGVEGLSVIDVAIDRRAILLPNTRLPVAMLDGLPMFIPPALRVPGRSESELARLAPMQRVPAIRAGQPLDLVLANDNEQLRTVHVQAWVRPVAR